MRSLCDIQNNQGSGRGYQLKPKAEADNTYRDTVDTGGVLNPLFGSSPFTMHDGMKNKM